jgi:hypothetical protein
LNRFDDSDQIMWWSQGLANEEFVPHDEPVCDLFGRVPVSLGRGAVPMAE